MKNCELSCVDYDCDLDVSVVSYVVNLVSEIADHRARHRKTLIQRRG